MRDARDALCRRAGTTYLVPRALIALTAVLLALGIAAAASANTPPAAYAGPDQTVSLGEPVMLDGWGEDPDGDPILEWSWAIESAPEGSLADLPDFMLPAPLFCPDLPGDYVLSLVVGDGLDYSLPDTVTVCVTAEPVATFSLSQTASASADPVVAWGNNFFGQCNVPGGLTGITAIAAGDRHSLALTDAGEVVAWGSGGLGQLEVPPLPPGVTYTAISAGRYHGLALTSDDGSVAEWGLGPPAPEGTGYTAIAAGTNHNLALTSDGTVVASGDNLYGQCDVPEGLTNVVAIALGWFHSLALKSDGTIVAWGWNGNGQCTVPALPEGATGWVAIAAAYEHSLGLTDTGEVLAWGWNFYGQCDVPDLPEGANEWIGIAAGWYHSLALTDTGQVVAWGRNNYGQRDVPEDLSGVIAIATGYNHNLALRTTNQPPVADAGPDQLVEATAPTTSFTLDGSGSSDPDDDPLTCAWTEGSTPVGTGDTITLAREVGSYTFTLTVTDPGELQDSDDVIITVRDTTPPVVTIVSPTAADYPFGSPILFDFSATDLACEPTVTADVDGQAVSSGDTRDDLPVGTHTLTVTATDDSGNSATEQCAFAVVNSAGKTTAGGWIELAAKKATCGFTVQYAAGDPVPTGNVEYVDHDLGMNVKSIALTAFGLSGNRAWVSGTCTVDGEPGHTFLLYAEDNSEDGKADFLSVTLDTGYVAASTLGGGNVTIHTEPPA